MYARWCALDRTAGQQLVEQGLGGVAGGAEQDRLGWRVGSALDWVGVMAEEVAEIEGVGDGFVDGDEAVIGEGRGLAMGFQRAEELGRRCGGR